MSTTTSRFPVASSMTATSIGAHTLAVPGRHEAAALSDMCPACGELDQRPATVLDVVERRRSTSRVASYRCVKCGACWLCSWAPAAGYEKSR